MDYNKLTKIILAALFVVLIGVLGHGVWEKRVALVEHQQPESVQSKQDSALQRNGETSSHDALIESSKGARFGIESIDLPEYCSFRSSAGNGWVVDCGKSTKNNARGFMGDILKAQDWKFCDEGLAYASWWKDGVITTVSEGGGDDSAASYPFSVSQNKGERCQ